MADSARKVLLLFGDFGRNPVFFDIMEPLVLEIFSAIATEEGCDPVLLDLRMDTSAHERLAESGYVPDLIAVTGRGYFEIPTINRLLATCKSLWPNTPVVLGGGQATITPELYDQQYVDVLVQGAGERLWRDMCRDGVTLHSPTLVIRDLEPSTTYSFPIPDRQSLAKYREKYVFYIPMHDGKSFKPASATVTSQGCPFRCTFCGVWPANLGLYRRRPIPEIVEELASIENDTVFLFDDNTLATTAYATELADAIGAAGINKQYLIYSRADHIVTHPDLIEKWASIGMRYVVLGVEAIGGDDELGAMNKQTTMEQNEEALGILRKAGVYCYAHILLTPEMTRKDFDRIYDFVAKHGLEYPITPYLTPLPGTQLFDEVKAEGRLLTENPKYYTLNYMVIRPTHLSIREYYREADRLYRRLWSWRRFLSGQCGDTNLLGFLQWFVFMRLLVFYFRLSRRAFYRELEAAGQGGAPIETATASGQLAAVAEHSD
jgi:hopanoid C-3 methylase